MLGAQCKVLDAAELEEGRGGGGAERERGRHSVRTPLRRARRGPAAGRSDAAEGRPEPAARGL